MHVLVSVARESLTLPCTVAVNADATRRAICTPGIRVALEFRCRLRNRCAVAVVVLYVLLALSARMFELVMASIPEGESLVPSCSLYSRLHYYRNTYQYASCDQITEDRSILLHCKNHTPVCAACFFLVLEMWSSCLLTTPQGCSISRSTEVTQTGVYKGDAVV